MIEQHEIPADEALIVTDEDGEVVGDTGTEVVVDGRKISVGNTFFRGESTIFYPTRDELRKPEGIGRYFLSGWVPAVSSARPGEQVLVLGCDIVSDLLRAAQAHGLTSTGLPGALDGGIAHVHGLRRVLAAALDQAADPVLGLDDQDLAALRAVVGCAETIVLCPGQSQYHVSQQPVQHLHLAPYLAGGAGPGVVDCLTATHAETVADLAACYRLLRQARPQAQIVLAVSPLPLAQNLSSFGPLVASIASKSTVRSAVDDFYRQARPGDDRLHYFPAFELVQTGLNYPFLADRRSLAPHALALLGTAFARAFALGVDDDALAAAHVEARQADFAAGEALRANPPVPLATAPHPLAWPDEAAMAADTTLEHAVLKGLMPAAPFVNADRTLIAFGSCFANNISRYLNTIGYNVATRRDAIAYVSRMGDGIVNTFAIRQQFEWAWEGKVPQVELWHDYKATEFGYDEGIRLRTRELFDMGDVFIITLGLSEVWYDEPTGEVFWRAVPADKYDPGRHKFRMISQAESLENLHAIYRLIRAHRPAAKIVFTVSPIPLMATFRGAATIVASAVSKAILRSAVDEFFQAHQAADPELYYFPAYEVVTGCFHEPFTPDLRHPFLHTILLNMKMFERYFCDSGLGDAQIAEFLAEVRYRDLALNGADRPLVMARIKEEADEWRGDGKVPCIESVARLKARDDVIAARAKERDEATALRQQELTAKRDEALAAREAAAEERRKAAEQRRLEAEAARAARARPAR
ncbi:hypothetical protein D3874_01250 [Oleomonas cavernae]|uniref:GSCFA domain-containing protein n=1 Tax=Oleomonas cavernae TaxID=2320859 RepID=A0A418WT88_9PROT|nr:GSCFA domain-containing protein [Oleomonas cavernae]RJF94492.1 hypothetical protein D3874_01250 [Oleomonas cavernae]